MWALESEWAHQQRTGRRTGASDLNTLWKDQLTFKDEFRINVNGSGSHILSVVILKVQYVRFGQLSNP